MAILTVKFYRGIIKSREKVSYNGRDYIYEYLYDTNGRLKSKKDIRRNGSVTENEDEYNYTYDKFGRMTKCAKTINGKGYTDTYTYNAAGNRTYQSEYIVQENKYRQKQYFWTRGKLLGQYLEDGTITTYKYDYADRLVKRTTGNSTMEYYYDGDRLVAQTSSDGSSIYYFYDDAGVCGAEYNNEYYEFVRNIFGDIVVVLKGGEIAGRYEYDPFGVCTEYTQNNFVKLNPFRYRGYFYDDVSGMYVLKTRYYDPVTAQFLSPDHPDYLDPETIGGIDLYAYCLNNPIIYIDSNGSVPISVWSNIFGFATDLSSGFGRLMLNASIKAFESIAGVSMYLFDDLGGAVFNPAYLKGIAHANKLLYGGKVLSTIGKAGKYAGYAFLTLDIGLSLYNNITDPNLSLSRKVTDSIVDVGFAVGGNFLSIGASAILMGVISGPWGVAIGAGAALAINLGVWAFQTFGTIYNDIKVNFNTFITQTVPMFWSDIVMHWNYFWSFDWI